MAPDPPTSISPREPILLKLREAALVVLLALTLNLAGNSRISLWDRDEPRYAGCTREMRASGDYIHPTFNAEPRYHKPVLIYWLMLAGTAIGGDNPFGARLVSSFAGAGTCLLVWALGRRILGRKAGLLAALMAATAPIMVVESKLATTDATLMFLCVSCQFALWELSRRPSRLAVGVFWVALGLSVLTKGPAGPVLIGAAAAVSWWWGGPAGWWGRLRWSWGLPILALIVAPWYIAIGVLSRGEYYHVAMGYHVIKRMSTGIETHGGFPGYYVACTLATFFPWSALLAPALLGGWFRRRSNPALGFLLGWIVGPLIVVECMGTKLIHYYLPAYPACALLVAWLIVAVMDAEVNLRRWPLGRVALALLTGIGIAATVGLVAGALVLPWSLRGPCLVMAIVLGAGTLYAMERFQAGATERAATSLVFTSGMMMFLAGAWLVPAVEPYRISPIVGRRLAAVAAKERATPMMGAFKPPGVVYYFGRPFSVMGGRADLIRQVTRDGPILSALTPTEFKVLSRDPSLALEVRDTVEGRNVENLKNETIRLVVIRPGGSGLAGRPEQAAVK